MSSLKVRESFDKSQSSEELPYAPARHVESLDDCYFYHTMDIPNVGTVEGEWDLRGGADEYLGNVELDGKRVLEVGTASGFLAFHMEQKGADVVGYDLNENFDWDIVPYSRLDLDAIMAKRKKHIRKLNNGWWFTHNALKSNANVVYGSVYDMPDSIGPVDVCTFGSILLHLQNPFRALQEALRFTRETVVVTDIPMDIKFDVTDNFGVPSMFLPNHRRREPYDTWWILPPELVQRYVGILGFEYSEVTYHRQTYQGKDCHLYTLVARRTTPFEG